ncbi:hypothetical protein HDV01_000007 [Terramyces sp. JEL0728]|nr:hypothetical protein HDV01_000007 [Terramyces sp. JEL0728]
MNKLSQYYASSDDEEEIRKPLKEEIKTAEKGKRKIFVPAVELEQHESNLKPELGPNLLASIPKAQSTTSKNISFGKLDKKPAKKEESVELDCFFTLRNSSLILAGQEQEDLGPQAGPERPSGQYNLQTFHIKKKVKVEQVVAIPERKSGPVKVTTISQKEQIGDVYRLAQQRQFTKSEFKASDSFKDRNNHILSLAAQAMQQSDKMADQKAERNALKKTVRNKYGF